MRGHVAELKGCTKGKLTHFASAFCAMVDLQLFLLVLFSGFPKLEEMSEGADRRVLYTTGGTSLQMLSLVLFS